MNISINAKDLLQVLSGSIVSGRSTLPIFEHVLLIAEGETLTVISCDTSVEQEAAIPCEVLTPGRATAHAAKLKSALFGRKNDIELELREGFINVKGAGGRYRIDSLPAQDYPNGPQLTGERGMDVDPVELANAIDRVAYAAGKKDVRYYLNGVCINGNAVSATDGLRLSQILVAGADIPESIIPNDSVRLISQALRETGAQLFCGDGCVEVRYEGGRIRSKLIDGRYPDFGPLLNQNATSFSADIDPEEAAPALKRMIPFANAHGSGRVITAGKNMAVAVNDDTDDVIGMFIQAPESDPSQTGYGINVQFLLEATTAIGVPFELSFDGSRSYYLRAPGVDSVDLLGVVKL